MLFKHELIGGKMWIKSHPPKALSGLISMRYRSNWETQWRSSWYADFIHAWRAPWVWPRSIYICIILVTQLERLESGQGYTLDFVIIFVTHLERLESCQGYTLDSLIIFVTQLERLESCQGYSKYWACEFTSHVTRSCRTTCLECRAISRLFPLSHDALKLSWLGRGRLVFSKNRLSRIVVF